MRHILLFDFIADDTFPFVEGNNTLTNSPCHEKSFSNYHENDEANYLRHRPESSQSTKAPLT